MAVEPVAIVKEVDADFSLTDLVARGILSPGDLLDPADPEWQVDAVISEDGTLVIDDEHAFDSLDKAARHLGVTNMIRFEFWALEVDDGVTPLTDLVS